MTANEIFQTAPDMEATGQTVSLCSIASAGEMFGIDTRKVREVLDRRLVRRVPLAPAYIAGLVPYRGEVLSTVSLRALRGQGNDPTHVCILVLEDTERGERFGLTVDRVDGVRTVCTSSFEANPCTLDDKTDAVFAGAYKTTQGLIIHLDPRKLRPSRLAAGGTTLDRI